MSHQDDKDEDQDQDTPQGLSDIEESAFYESGLTAHGCIDNLDTYAMESIKRYGMILFKAAYKDYAVLMLDTKKLEKELEEAREEIKLLKAIMDVMKDKANE